MSTQPRARARRRSVRVVGLALVAGVTILLAFAALSLFSRFHQFPQEDRTTLTAEWARDHGLGIVVTAIENVQYRLNPPVTGGTPDLAQLPQRTNRVHATDLQPALKTVVSPALRGEGAFTDVGGRGRRGLLQIAYLRPDTIHTSYLTGVAWISRNDRFVLHPGYEDPGIQSGWTQRDEIKGAARRSLLATFNGGFKIKDALGGYYDHGTQVGQLVPGAASLVIDKSGHATVGAWGSDVSMTSNVAYVRQNLKLLIANGVVAKDLNANVESNWGATVGGDLAVWRSGLGVTATGDLVYVMGDALTVTSLADLLHRAGAVNAMQMDINRAWISFMYYRTHGKHIQPKKMGNFQDAVDRYLHPTNRDFIAVYAPTTTAQHS